MDRRMAIFRWIFPAGIAIACLGFGALLQPCYSAAPQSERAKRANGVQVVNKASCR
jgi:hypothetical protein